MSRRINDKFTRMARNKGFPARSMFKLKEIHDKYRVLRPGARVLDLGCAPGSWTKFAAQRVGSKGFVLGLDLTKVDMTTMPKHVKTMQQDVYTWAPERGGEFDMVLSDMAPRTTGIKDMDAAASVDLADRALEVCRRMLRHRGTVLLKVFHGADFPAFQQRFSGMFNTVKTFKPHSSRRESVEVFVLGKGWKHRPPVVKDGNSAQQQVDHGEHSTDSAAPEQ